MSDKLLVAELDQGVVDPVSPMGAVAAITIIDEKRRFNLRVKDDNFAQVASAANIDLPRQIGQSSSSNDVTAFCLGPDEWVLIGDAETDIVAMFTGAPKPYSLVDISHRNVGIEIFGPGAASLINLGCPLDLALNAFPIGKVTRTVFERAEIILHRIGDEKFQIEVWRSFAPYFVRILEKNS